MSKHGCLPCLCFTPTTLCTRPTDCLYWVCSESPRPYLCTSHAPHGGCVYIYIQLLLRNAFLLRRKKGSVLFKDTLNTFYLQLYGIRHMVKDHPDNERGNPLPPHGLHFRLAARVILYAPSHRQDSTYHGLCYTSHGALAGMRNSSMGPP